MDRTSRRENHVLLRVELVQLGKEIHALVHAQLRVAVQITPLEDFPKQGIALPIRSPGPLRCPLVCENVDEDLVSSTPPLD